MIWGDSSASISLFVSSQIFSPSSFFFLIRNRTSSSVLSLTFQRRTLSPIQRVSAFLLNLKLYPAGKSLFKNQSLSPSTIFKPSGERSLSSRSLLIYLLKISLPTFVFSITSFIFLKLNFSHSLSLALDKKLSASVWSIVILF